MLKAVCDVQIENEDYKIIVNVGSMVNVERISGKKFIEIVKDAESGSILALALLLSACLTKDNEPVGMKFVESMDFDVFQDLSSPLVETVIKAFPKKNDKKKVKILTPVK